MGVSARAIISQVIIPASGTDSNWVENHEDAAAIAIQSPAAFDAGTFSIQVSNDKTLIATLQDGAPLADVAVPAASKAAVYNYLACFKYWRIHCTGAQTNAKTFVVTKLAVNS